MACQSCAMTEDDLQVRGHDTIVLLHSRCSSHRDLGSKKWAEQQKKVWENYYYALKARRPLVDFHSHRAGLCFCWMEKRNLLSIRANPKSQSFTCPEVVVVMMAGEIGARRRKKWVFNFILLSSCGSLINELCWLHSRILKVSIFYVPWAVNRMFSGLMSRCRQPCLWQYATPSSVWYVICAVMGSGQPGKIQFEYVLKNSCNNNHRRRSPCGFRSSSCSTVCSQNSNTKWSRRLRRNTSRRHTKLGCFKFWTGKTTVEMKTKINKRTGH